ncbi:hypothetical protein [Microbacterium stercoris]|uniref:Uncharacterized protein n=1 Tax=Microbacterium stercoris TaxID=2820289 RepID=A0A939QG86_9MICO|nr:hypothetical protein [Microbacterium stercoris]MBO3662389.1 hypothetical protein [Microbacterium stercoris]MBO3664381.1 hypothetical protein [Microbacterium stercoris]
MTYTEAAARRMAQLREESLTDATLEELVGLMLTGAIRRQLWLMFLDDDDRMSEAIMPTTDFPEDPHEPAVVEDLGPVTAARLIADRIGRIGAAIDVTQLVVVWEREGEESFRDEELAWAAAMADAMAETGMRLRAQYLLHNTGLRVLAPDDYALDAARH